MQINQATRGEVKLFEHIRGHEVHAIRSYTHAGDGWRPVCRGRYLGVTCSRTEGEALKHGAQFVAQLQRRVDGVPAEPAKPPVKKRERKSKAVIQ